MRIAFFADNFYPESSGVTETILATGIELARLGHTIEYFVPKYGKKDYKKGGAKILELDLGPNIKVHRITSLHVTAPSDQGRAYIPNPLRGLFNKNKFDIIHSHAFFGAGIDALCLAKLTKTPFVGTNHTLMESFTQYLPINKITGPIVTKYVSWYFNQCDFVTTPTEFLLDDMKHKGLKPGGLSVSNPIKLPFFERGNKEELRSKLNLSSYTFINVSRLAKEKNVETILEAFIPFALEHADASLIFIGNGLLKSKLIQKIKENKLEKQIKIIGPFTAEERQTLFDYFHASDAFIIASTSETQSMVTLEAMASGLPIIATTSAALPEVVGESRGLMFKVDDTNDLRVSLEKLYTDKESSNALSKNALTYAEERTPEKIAKKWEEIYKEVINRKTHEN